MAVIHHEQQDWVITIINRTSGDHALTPVLALLNDHNLQPGKVHKLPHSSYYASAIWASPRASQSSSASTAEPTLRAALSTFADTLAIDIVLQPASEYARQRRLFAFDMDSTLIQGEVIDELAKMAGVADRVVAITASAMRGEIEFQESFRRRVALLAGLPASRAHELLNRIPLMQGTERLFAELKQRGVKTAILSGGFTFFGDHLQHRLGIDHVFANQLDVDADGYVTGQVRGPIVDGARKAALLQQIAHQESIPLEQVVAVGDGANDLPMLALAGMGIAFHAKPVVRAAARYSLTHAGLDALLSLIGQD